MGGQVDTVARPPVNRRREPRGKAVLSESDRVWGNGGTLGYVITVDYRRGIPRGGTWPGGRATLQGNHPRGLRARQIADDARYIYISYTLLAELHLFEQVKTTLPTHARFARPLSLLAVARRYKIKNRRSSLR